MAQFAVYPLDMNIYGERYEVGFVTSVCTYPEYTGHGLMKKLMRKSLTRMRDSNKSFALCIHTPYLFTEDLAGRLSQIR